MLNWKALTGASVILSVVGLSGAASAALITDGALTLDTNPTDIFQQTAASPCVIGGNNCLNGAFPMTTVQGGGGGEVKTGITSPTYSIAAITAVVGTDPFTIGIDYNQANDPQRLDVFSAIFDVGGTQTFDISTVLQTNNNGVGFSDFLLSGFVIPNGATTVTFSATWFDNDGPDRYFLIGAEATPIPEPLTLGLIGFGLIGVGAVARRMRRS